MAAGRRLTPYKGVPMIDNITLYADSQFISPYVMSVFVTLTEKKIPFQIKKIDLETGENLKREYALTSLTQRVPTLTNGDFSLSESSAITEYLEELYPPPKYQGVYPEGLELMARARQIQAWIRSDFLSIREERCTEVIFGQPADKALSEAAQAEAARLFSAADTLIDKGSGNLFKEWCIADTDLALMLNRLVLNGDKVPDKLADYARIQWERPSVQLWVKKERTI